MYGCVRWVCGRIGEYFKQPLQTSPPEAEGFAAAHNQLVEKFLIIGIIPKMKWKIYSLELHYSNAPSPFGVRDGGLTINV